VHLSATNPDHVELSKHSLSIPTSDVAKKMVTWAASTNMLKTALLCNTSSPDRMIALADFILNASSEATSHPSAFNN